MQKQPFYKKTKHSTKQNKTFLQKKTFYRTVHQFRTFLSVLFVTPHLQSGIVFLKLLFLI